MLLQLLDLNIQAHGVLKYLILTEISGEPRRGGSSGGGSADVPWALQGPVRAEGSAGGADLQLDRARKAFPQQLYF